MNRASLTVVGALVLSIAMGGAASAQMSGGTNTPVPGSGDATKISNGNRESMSDYNHLVSEGVKAQNVNGEKTKTAAKPVKATAADIQAGAALRAIDGPQIGTVVSLNADQVVVDTGQAKIGVPLLGFGKDGKGLVLNMTAAKFRDAVAQAHAAHAAADTQQN